MKRATTEVRVAALAALLALGACSTPGPVFESTSISDVVRFGGDCAENRCVMVTAMARGSRAGTGSCAAYGPSYPDRLKPLAKDDSIEMVPDQESEWIVELPENSPDTSKLNAVCEPMMEG